MHSRWLGLPFLFAFGCNPVTTPGNGKVSAPIIGGTSDNGDPSVVALFASQPGAQDGSLCTATVISPTVLVTAAHCVSPDEVGPGAQFVVLLGNNLDSSSVQALAVADTTYDTAFDPNSLDGGHDIGLVRLAKPTTLTPIPFNRDDPSGLAGGTVRLVGYGVNSGKAQTGAGQKRTVKATLDSVDSLLLHIGDSRHETCQGDSGGPALATIGGVETIVGVTSWGLVGCTGGGYDTRVDLYTDLIDQYLAASSPTDPGTGP
jgi:secreted trypsin-like serine protease